MSVNQIYYFWMVSFSVWLEHDNLLPTHIPTPIFSWSIWENKMHLDFFFMKTILWECQRMFEMKASFWEAQIKMFNLWA